MNRNLLALKESVRDRRHRRHRLASAPDVAADCSAKGLSLTRRMARRLQMLCEAEAPVIEPDEQIVFTRTVPTIPPLYTEHEADAAKELYFINNLCPDWGTALAQGLLGRRKTAEATLAGMSGDPGAVEFLESAIASIDAVLGLASKYAAKARTLGREDIAARLDRVPARPAATFHEALQSLRILHAMVYLAGHYHVGLGRFDQYMWPYVSADLQAGRLTEESAEALLAEFFISLNKDTDLYFGVIRGDNGQTIVLGGVTKDGRNAENPLTRMTMKISRDLGLIDPKINLRISAKTDLELLSLASELTRKGLGFPQYANDDVVIPALVAHGYDLEDARNYVVAACWEFIIPGKGMEIVNVDALAFPLAADQGIRAGLAAGDDFEGIMARVKTNITRQVEEKIRPYYGKQLAPAPFFSVVMGDCLERGRDLSQGLKYNNFGMHGSCSASAADALAAVKQFVRDEKTVTEAELIRALDANFEGCEDLRRKLAEKAPKVGNNDDRADGILARLFDFFADACEAFGENGRGGILRPGTGTAMYYISIAKGLGATAEGRKQGEYFSANLAPAPNVRLRGPISVLQSYAKIPYARIYNGGPITMELSDSVFRDADSIRKVAMLIRTFARLGGQQLQLNALNGEKLLEAKAHPERHKNLIVRVWGWSGYFCELPPEYQDQVLRRHLHANAD